MYTIKSVSADGTYYLVNGWNKWNAWWTPSCMVGRNLFKSIGLAKRSLKRLQEYEPDFLNDEITILKYDEESKTLIPVNEKGEEYV